MFKNICSLPVILPQECKMTLIIMLRQVTRDRLNNASFRQRLDPISKNIFRRQNLLKLVFEETSTFDAKNPIVGSLQRELHIGRKHLTSEFIKKAPGVDLGMQKKITERQQQI